MIRTQIQLTENQAKSLKRLSTQRGQSIAELIRQSIDLYIQKVQQPEVDEEEKWQRARAISGMFRSGVSDLSTNHDEYFAEAIEYSHQHKN